MASSFATATYSPRLCDQHYAEMCIVDLEQTFAHFMVPSEMLPENVVICASENYVRYAILFVSAIPLWLLLFVLDFDE